MSIIRSTLSDQRKAAITAGAALIIMALAASFSYGFAHANLVAEGNADTTLQNIITQNNLFRTEIAGWLLIVILDIIVAWSCYITLKPIHRNLSLLGAWLRLAYAALLGTAVMNLLFVQLLSNSTFKSPEVTSSQLGGQIMLYLQAFDSMWSLGLIIFGGHLLILGILAIRSDHVPQWIGILLLIASAGYILVHLSKLLFAGEGIGDILEVVFVVPMSAGELGFAVWLLLRGGKVTV